MDTTVENAFEIPLACQVCGRRDETVRFIAYPYVISLVVVTFQRAFLGCWCRIHRIQRWLAASLITLIFGWFGFPFGLIFTPFRLLQLGQGGIQDSNINSLLLGKLGMEKQEQGDIPGAIKSYETSLLYADNPEIIERLRRLYQYQPLKVSSGLTTSLLGFVGSFVFPIILALVGIVIGFIDNLVKLMVLPGTEVPIILFIILQVPLVMSAFFLGVVSKYFLRILTIGGGLTSSWLAYLTGGLSALLFVNGLVSGETFGIYFYYYFNGYQESFADLADSLAAIMTRGSLYIFSPVAMATNLTGNLVFGGILLLSMAFFLLVQFHQIRASVSQRTRLQMLIHESDTFDRSSGLGGWVGFAGLLALVIVLLAGNSQKTSIDALEAFDHIGSALGHVNSGEYDRAITEYKAATEARPGFPLSYVGLGYAFYFTGDLDQAQENFKQALALHSGIPEAHTGLGWVYTNQGKYDLAESEFNSVLQSNPQNLEAHMGLGWLNLNRLDLEASREEFETVLSIAPDIAEAYYGLGAVEMTARDYDEAINLFDEALRLNPSITLAHVYKGSINYRLEKYSEAEDAFQAAIKLEPGSYLALSGLGNIRVANYVFDEAVDYYDQAIAADPERTDAYINKAYVLLQMGNPKEALSLLEPHSEKDGNILALMSLIYQMQGDELNGEKFLGESQTFAGELDGFERGGVYYSIAGVKIALSDFPEAKRFGELVSADNTVSLDAREHFFMSRIYSALGEFDNARAALERGGSMTHSERELHVTTAVLLIDQELLADAENELESAIALDVKSSDAHALLSFVHYHQRDYSLAISEAETAIQLNPYNAYAHTQLAFAYKESGRTEEALSEAQEAVRLNTLDGTAHYVLGVCYLEMGRAEDAIGEFEEFLARYWDRAYIREYKIKAEEYLGQLKQSP